MRNGNGFEDKRIKTKTLNYILLAAIGVMAAAAIFAVVFKFVIGNGNRGKNDTSEEAVETVTEGEDASASETSGNTDTGNEAAGVAGDGDDSGNVASGDSGIGDTESGDADSGDSGLGDTGSDDADFGDADISDTDSDDAAGSGSGDAGYTEDGDDESSSDDGFNVDDSYIAEPEEIEIVEDILAGMTLHEKACQLFVVYPTALTGVKRVTEAGAMTRNALSNYPVGGFLYNASNMDSYGQLNKMLTGVQNMTKIPLILTCDEEGGRVERLMGNVGTTSIGPMYYYRKEGTETAYDNAFIIGSDMKSVGMNMDLAPVADVWSNPDNTVIGDRAYSDDFSEAAELIAEAVKGFHDGGVACTLKHFPGHGDTAEDTHYNSAVVTKSLDELRDEEFLPFKAGIKAGADAVMIAHVIVSDVADEPAVFSKEIITDILRGELGFNGVVITDALEMGAIANSYTSADAALMSFKAGADILLCPADFKTAEKAIEDAVTSGDVEEERLNESVRRILTLKYNSGLLGE